MNFIAYCHVLMKHSLQHCFLIFSFMRCRVRLKKYCTFMIIIQIALTHLHSFSILKLEYTLLPLSCKSAAQNSGCLVIQPCSQKHVPRKSNFDPFKAFKVLKREQGAYLQQTLHVVRNTGTQQYKPQTSDLL